MTTVTISISQGIMEIKAEGHANYDEHGKDIVCAAVSAIMQTCALGLQAVAEEYPKNVKIILDKN